MPAKKSANKDFGRSAGVPKDSTSDRANAAAKRTGPTTEKAARMLESSASKNLEKAHRKADPIVSKADSMGNAVRDSVLKANKKSMQSADSMDIVGTRQSFRADDLRSGKAKSSVVSKAYKR